MTQILWRWWSSWIWWSLYLGVLLFHVAMAKDVKPQKERYTPDYSLYHNLSSIGSTIDRLINTHPSIFKHLPNYVSKLGNLQHVIHVTNFSHVDSGNDLGLSKVKVLMSFGEHAREFLPVESVLYLLKVLSSPHIDASLFKTLDLNKLDLYIIVMANPDGRKYVEEEKNYCWRGTSRGVDLNRNFDWEFGGKGSSADNRDEEYRGLKAFSEPETRVYQELTEQITFDAFVSLHSGIRHIYLPYADSLSQKIDREPDNISEMMKLAKTLSTCSPHKFQYGKSADLNKYSADGTVFDYMAGVRKIPFSYAIELWGPVDHKGNSCFDLFNPSNTGLQQAVEDIFPLYTTLFDYLIHWKISQTAEELSDSGEPHEPGLQKFRTSSDKVQPSMTLGHFLLVLVVLVTIAIGLHGKFRRLYQRRRVVSLRSLSSSFSASMFST